MKSQPLLILLLCFIGGIVLQEIASLSGILVFSLLACSAILLFLTFIKAVFIQKVKYFLLGFFFVSTGVFVHFQNAATQKIPVLKEKENIVFQLNKKLNANEKNRRYIVEVLAVPSSEIKDFVPVKTVLSIPKEQAQLDFNHFYDAEVYIHQPEHINNDFQFDYRKYLARQGVYLQAYLPGEMLRAKKSELTFAEEIRQKRLDILNKINQTSLSPRIQEFLKGIILADRTEMDKETVNDFNQTGLTHLLAISGSHMVVIFWITLLVLNQIIPLRFRKFSIIFSLILIWSFGIFIDYGSSVMRSCLMISCYYIMVLLQRKPDLLHSAALSAFIILVLDSNQLFDVGFQLIYLAVLGIWWLANPIKKLFRKPKFGLENFVYSITAMTFAAQISTLPLVIFYFHQFSLVSIFANLIIIPLSEVLIVSSLLMVVLIACGVQISWLFKGFDVLIDSVLQFIHWFSGFQTLMHRNIPLNVYEVAILLIIVFFIKFLLKDLFNPKYMIRFISCLLLFLMMRICFNFYNYEKKEVLVHRFYKEKIISVKERGEIVFWLKNDKNQEKIQDFVINPYLVSRRITGCKIQYIPENSEGFVYEKNYFDLSSF